MFCYFVSSIFMFRFDSFCYFCVFGFMIGKFFVFDLNIVRFFVIIYVKNENSLE